MPRTFQYRMTNAETSEAVELHAEFTHDEWSKMQRFREFAAELAECAQVKAGLMNNYSIHFGANGQITVTSEPDRSAFAELALFLRPFVLQNESTYFTRITGIMRRRLTHPRLRSLLANWNGEFANKGSQALYELTIGHVGMATEETRLNSEQTLYTWLNGSVYHRDQDKRLAIANLANTLPLPVVNAIMFDLLAVKAACVLHLAQFIAALDRGDAINIGSDSTHT